MDTVTAIAKMNTVINMVNAEFDKIAQEYDTNPEQDALRFILDDLSELLNDLQSCRQRISMY